MTIRPLLAAALGLSFAMPATAQDSAGAKPAADERGERRLFVQAVPGFGGKNRPQPVGSSQNWVTNADYPLASWRNREEGTVQYDLAVDATGAVTGCTITYSTASPALEAETCRLLLERARYEPAEDADGKRVASSAPGEFVWKIREPEFASAFTIKVMYTLDERGQQRDCRVIERTGTIPTDMQRSLARDPCRGSTSIRGVPYRDAEGRPVAREVTVSYGLDVAPMTPAPSDALPGN